MSIEIWLFPKKATDSDLSEFLFDLNYNAGDNIFFPGPEGTQHFFWSEPDDFKSTSGVDASIFPINKEGKKAWDTNSDWGLHTKTSIWASSFDKEFQNHTIRVARRKFGGKFYNDHFGNNRYIVIEKKPSTPASRGIFAVHARITGELDSLEHALPEEMVQAVAGHKGKIYTKDNDPLGIFQLSREFDPSRTIYNALVPFLVASLEHFFSEIFQILLRYDKSAREKLLSQSRKISIAEAALLASGDVTLEEVAANWYSFQNIDSIHKAYSELLDINFWRILRRRKKVQDKLPLLSDALATLITARHGIVHHFTVDRELDQEGFLNLLHLVKAIMDVFVTEVEKKLDVEIGPG